MSFLEAKTVKTFIGLVVDVALPRGNGNDFDDDDDPSLSLHPSWLVSNFKAWSDDFYLFIGCNSSSRDARPGGGQGK